MNHLELPTDFPHKAPEGYSYEVCEFKRNVIAIWLQHHSLYNYSTDSIRTIWGFYHQKKREYYAPINASKQGDKVDIKDTRDFTAMQLKLTPLEMAYV